MKTLKINKLILLLLSFVLVNSCVQDDDFETPNLSFDEPNISNVREMSSLAGDLAQEQSANDNIFEPQPLDYSNESDTVSYLFNENDEYISGYVVSSDEAGNYFEELIIQDKAENPTIGIKLLIDVNPLFTKYEVGRKIYVKINGLSVGITNGVLTLGSLNGGEVDKIASSQETLFIQRSNEVATIVPLPLNISDFSVDKTNLMIALNDVQFNRNEVLNEESDLTTYASSQSDQFDGERTLESCASSASAIFSTSTFADFKGLPLPTGRGSMNAILSRNFEGEAFIISVNTPEDILFDNAERCDPIVFECDGPFGGGSVLFSENFTAYANIGQAEAAGWTNINTTGGSLEYVLGNFSGNKYAQISGFGSSQAEIDTWLVTPEINLDATTGESLTFDLEVAFANSVILSVLITDDYTGDVTTTEWLPLDVVIPSTPASGFGGFNNVGNINISCLDGNVRVAFRYQGSDPSATTRYHVDNVTVRGN